MRTLAKWIVPAVWAVGIFLNTRYWVMSDVPVRYKVHGVCLGSSAVMIGGLVLEILILMGAPEKKK